VFLSKTNSPFAQVDVY
jgi:hypothetical protein